MYLSSRLFRMLCYQGKNQRNLLFTLKKRNYGSLDYVEYEDTSQKTKLELSSREEGIHPLMLTGYTRGGFVFGKLLYRSPIAILDNVILKWNVFNPEEITSESLALFNILYPKIDILIIGTGDKFVPLNPKVVKEMKTRGLSIEVQSTRHACGTYNLLKTSNPAVMAAALIPIKEVIVNPPINKGKRFAVDS